MADHGLTLRILSVLVVIATVLLIIQYYQRRKASAERFAEDPFGPVYSTDVYGTAQSAPGAAAAAEAATMPYDQGVPFYAGDASTASPDGASGGTAPADPTANEVFRAVDYQVQSPPTNTGCFPKDRLTAQDLLPKDAANSTWSKVMPAGQGDVSNQNFLTAGYQLGISSAVIRNPNYGLRSEPPNPQAVVSPWLNTTIDPDLMRRPLELASAPEC